MLLGEDCGGREQGFCKCDDTGDDTEHSLACFVSEYTWMPEIYHFFYLLSSEQHSRRAFREIMARDHSMEIKKYTLFDCHNTPGEIEWEIMHDVMGLGQICWQLLETAHPWLLNDGGWAVVHKERSLSADQSSQLWLLHACTPWVKNKKTRHQTLVHIFAKF